MQIDRLRQQQLDSGAARRDRNGRVYLAAQPQQQMTLSLASAVPAQSLPHHTAQANIASTNPQYQNPQYPHSSDSAHLLIACATYTNSRTREKDAMSWILDSGATHHLRMTCRTSRSINFSVRLRKFIWVIISCRGPGRTYFADWPIHLDPSLLVCS